jgi:hypothetical protein
VLTLLLAVGIAVQATPKPPDPLRVLFIGNSYTYFHNAPEVFAALARAAQPGREVQTAMVVVGGETLLGLWERSPARQAIRESKWDYVVLQDQSRLGEGLWAGTFVINAPRLFRWGAGLFDADIRRAGARTVLMQHWARRNQGQDQPALDHAFDTVAREVGALLAPAGRAWQRAAQAHPTIELYAADRSHPAPAGSYLLACVLLFSLLPDALTAELPELPVTITGHAVSSAGVADGRSDRTLVALPPEHGTALQAVARSVVDEVRKSGGLLKPAAAPWPTPPPLPAGTERLRPEALAGSWVGSLSFFPRPARFELTLRFQGEKCEGEAVIDVLPEDKDIPPKDRRRYESPIANCAVTADDLTFSIGTMGLPSLVDRYVGRWVDGKLIGTVERTGRELTNDMSGVWGLRRPPEDAPKNAP